MFDTFGAELPLAARFFIAFLVVLALIGVTAWLVRRFGSNRLGGGSGRGRQPRLAVIDAASVDGRRRLVLIRRDNIEHLLMIGGPTDVVIEPNIVRATRDAGVTREAPRELGREPSVRSDTTAWPLQPLNELPPVAPSRPSHRAPAATEEPWLPPEPGARPRPADGINGTIAEFPARRVPDAAPPPIERHEPRVSQARVPSDHNLAEMAQQLEAALRRAPAPEGRPPVTDPLATQAPFVTPKSPETSRAPVAEFKPRPGLKIEPKVEAKSEPKPVAKLDSETEPKRGPNIGPTPERKPEIRVEPKIELKSGLKAEPNLQTHANGQSAAKPEALPLDKDLYDNLEEEMANLLGRPSAKS